MPLQALFSFPCVSHILYCTSGVKGITIVRVLHKKWIQQNISKNIEWIAFLYIRYQLITETFVLGDYNDGHYFIQKMKCNA